jgi:hypothetical protein
MRIKDSPSTEVYTESEEDEDSDVVALNVVGTVSRPLLRNYIVSDMLRAYKPDKDIRKNFKNPEEERF